MGLKVAGTSAQSASQSSVAGRRMGSTLGSKATDAHGARDVALIDGELCIERSVTHSMGFTAQRVRDTVVCVVVLDTAQRVRDTSVRVKP